MSDPPVVHQSYGGVGARAWASGAKRAPHVPMEADPGPGLRVNVQCSTDRGEAVADVDESVASQDSRGIAAPAVVVDLEPQAVAAAIDKSDRHCCRATRMFDRVLQSLMAAIVNVEFDVRVIATDPVRLHDRREGRPRCHDAQGGFKAVLG